MAGLPPGKGATTTGCALGGWPSTASPGVIPGHPGQPVLLAPPGSRSLGSHWGSLRERAFQPSQRGTTIRLSLTTDRGSARSTTHGHHLGQGHLLPGTRTPQPTEIRTRISKTDLAAPTHSPPQPTPLTIPQASGTRATLARLGPRADARTNHSASYAVALPRASPPLCASKSLGPPYPAGHSEGLRPRIRPIFPSGRGRPGLSPTPAGSPWASLPCPQPHDLLWDTQQPAARCQAPVHCTRSSPEAPMPRGRTHQRQHLPPPHDQGGAPTAPTRGHDAGLGGRPRMR